MIETIRLKSRDEWLKQRLQDLTASVIPALWDLHPYTTIYELYHEKKGRNFRETNASMIGGTYLEPAIVQYLMDQNPTWQFHHSSKEFIYYRDSEARIGATPDVIVQHPTKGKGVIQIKTTNYQNFKKSWHDQSENLIVPDWIKIQTLVEAHLTESHWAAVAVATLDPWNVTLIEVDAQSGLIEAIKGKSKEFWKSFEEGIEPQPDYLKDAKTIQKLSPEPSQGKRIDLTGNNRISELILNRAKYQKLKKSSEDAMKAIDAEVTILLGDAEIADLKEGKTISWVTTNRKSYTVEASVSKRLKYPKIDEAEITL